LHDPGKPTRDQNWVIRQKIEPLKICNGMGVTRASKPIYTYCRSWIREENALNQTSRPLQSFESRRIGCGLFQSPRETYFRCTATLSPSKSDRLVALETHKFSYESSNAVIDDLDLSHEGKTQSSRLSISYDCPVDPLHQFYPHKVLLAFCI
jgi:hypothetical protein